VEREREREGEREGSKEKRKKETTPLFSHAIINQPINLTV
jgi:hypothetical protein